MALLFGPNGRSRWIGPSLIVDGDTGVILDSNVRGDDLAPAIERGLAKKKPAK